LVTGHAGHAPDKVVLDADTLAMFMCGSTIASIARALLGRGDVAALARKLRSCGRRTPVVHRGPARARAGAS